MKKEEEKTENKTEYNVIEVEGRKFILLDDFFKTTKEIRNTNYVINETSKPNSFETGSSGKRWKFYFNDVTDLSNQIKKLKEAGFEIENIPEGI